MDPILQRALDDARAGRLDAALAGVRRVIQRQPANVEALQVIALLLMRSGQATQAAHHLERAVQLAPGSAPLRNNLAAALMSAGRAGDAADQARRAVEIDPGYADGWQTLSYMLLQIEDARGAVAAAERGLALRPDSAELTFNLALALGAASRIQDLLPIVERGHRQHPQHANLHSLYLMVLNYSGRPAAEVAEAHREFGRLHPAATGSSPARTDPDPERPLRVGWLSRDLCSHSVSYFVEALLARTPAGIETHALSLNTPARDERTERLRGMVRHWHDVSALDDAALDRRIREELIDILIELQGHTAANRLTMLASKPAPVIVTAIGYPNTTGVGAVDYRLVDSITDPAGAESLATERLLRVDPCFLCYSPPEAPEPAMPDEEATTFGSFNTSSKIGLETIDLWRGVLEAAPGSRLVVKAADLGDEQARAELSDRLVHGGLEGGRVEVVARTAGLREHLEHYHGVHIALDTSPYNGTTTTCEALWMGVPVVTLRGDRHASRVGATLLAAVGRVGWVAESAADYARIAAALAADREQLAVLRSGLRAEVRVSRLCDAEGYAAAFYRAIRGCWREWCAGRNSTMQGPHGS